MNIAEIVALILKWTAIAQAAGPNVALALAEIEKLVTMLGGLIGNITTKKPTQEQIDAVKASSKALTDAINATP